MIHRSLFLWLSILSLFLLIPFGCSPPELHETLTGDWEFAYYEYPQTGEQSLPPDHLPYAVTVDFEDNGRRGQFDVSTITNRMLGEYRLDESGSLSVLEIQGTQVGEPEWVVPLWAALATANAYQRTGSTLKIWYQESQKTLVFHQL